MLNWNAGATVCLSNLASSFFYMCIFWKSKRVLESAYKLYFKIDMKYENINWTILQNINERVWHDPKLATSLYTKPNII